MLVDERMVIQIPKSIVLKSNRQKSIWIRKLITRAIMEARARILDKTECDIFNVFVMTDCVEISIKGDIEARHLDKEEYKPWMNRKWYRKHMDKKRAMNE